jgi:hypothetical protein
VFDPTVCVDIVTKEYLLGAIAQLEGSHRFPSRNALFKALAQTPWAQAGGLTADSLKAKARRWGIQPSTPPAPCPAQRPRRDQGQIEGESVSSAPGPSGAAAVVTNGVTKAGRTKRLSLPLLRAETPAEWRHLVDRAEEGSVKAMIRLMCGDCVGWELKEARECELTACPLHPINPWRRSRRAKAKKAATWHHRS